MLTLERAMPRVAAMFSAGSGPGERKRRAWIWATVRLMPQRVPISPQCRMNFCCTGVSLFINHGHFCINRIYRIKRPQVKAALVSTARELKNVDPVDAGAGQLDVHDALEAVKKALDGKKPKKVIIVRHRIVNVVV